MADVFTFETREQIAYRKLAEKVAKNQEVSVGVATELTKMAMEDLLKLYAEYGIKYDQNSHAWRQFSAIQILLYIHTCEQCGYEHPMIDYLNEVAEEVDEMINLARDLSKKS